MSDGWANQLVLCCGLRLRPPPQVLLIGSGRRGRSPRGADPRLGCGVRPGMLRAGRAGARQKCIWGAQGAVKVRAASFDLECVQNEYCRTIVLKVTKQLESTALARGKGFSESTAFRAPVRISGATAGESCFGSSVS